MVKFWQISNMSLKSIYPRCSVKKFVFKNSAIFIEKYLFWSLSLISLQTYKPATSLQKDSNTNFFLWILRNFLKIKGHLRTAAFELYWLKLEVIIEKTETYSNTYSEMRNRDVFNTQWNIFDGAFSKNSCLHLAFDCFCKTLHIICFTALWICPDKIKPNPNVLSFISQRIRTTISASWVLRSHFFKCTKTWRHLSLKNIKLAISFGKKFKEQMLFTILN